MALNLHDRANLERFLCYTLLIEDLTSGHIVEGLRNVSELCGEDSAYSPAQLILSGLHGWILGIVLLEAQRS